MITRRSFFALFAPFLIPSIFRRDYSSKGMNAIYDIVNARMNAAFATIDDAMRDLASRPITYRDLPISRFQTQSRFDDK